ncbi:MAG: S46 family peptidase, partial [Chitinophagaceae bacterium]|nr:S46 family peptidase [Chitinophagaceae bacterium]
MNNFQVGLLRKTLIIIILVGSGLNAQSKKGMWLPPLLKSQEAEMIAAGLNIPVEQLYNADGTGLNNAVVLFGSGCTAEVISKKGLLLTNHHCGYGTVQGLSSKEHDYFADGFWAQKYEDELPCGGLTVTFIRKIENVTDKITVNLDDTLSETVRDSIIAIRIKNLQKGYKYTTGYDAIIKPYYEGNQYWALLTEKYTDIRLVGFPPNGVGSFGGDTDNWMWPRHTGDFSMFRIYAGKDNKPAPYSKDNKPYDPDKYLAINTGGYKEGDYTMVYGFPGRTQQYISSYQLNQIYNIIDPIRIEVRTTLLETWAKHMDADRDVFLKYTSKHKRVANGWKKWQGEVRGLRLNNVPEKKMAYEQSFQGLAAADETLPYADDLLARIGAVSNAANDVIKAEEFIREAVLSVELIRQGQNFEKMLAVYRSGITDDELSDSLKRLAKSWNGYFKNYDATTDKDVFTQLMPLFFAKCPQYVPSIYKEQLQRYGNDYPKWANYVYNSAAASQSRLEKLAESTTLSDSMSIVTDPAWILYNAINTVNEKRVKPALTTYNEQMSYLNRLYMKAQMTLDHNTNFFPDANLTLRLTYGNVKGIDPDGPAGYSFQTNLDEAVAKHNPDIEEFDMPEKLREIHKNKNYGRWAVNGTVPIAFIATNHTTGGNSGSPVLNSKGELIGLNFDRIWEGTMSDLYFDPG